MLQNVVSVNWKSCEVIIFFVILFLNYSSSSVLCLLIFQFTNMLEDPIWCFLSMRCEMEEDNSGLTSMDTSNKVGNKKSQSSKSFQS